MSAGQRLQLETMLKNLNIDVGGANLESVPWPSCVTAWWRKQRTASARAAWMTRTLIALKILCRLSSSTPLRWTPKMHGLCSWWLLPR